MNKKIVVGVTAIKTIESPQPGFAIARGLKPKGYRVIGIDDTPLTSAVHSSYFDAVYVVPALATEDFSSFFSALQRIHEKEHLDVLIPCFDRDVFFMLKYREDIEQLGIRLLLPTVKNLLQTSKPFLSQLSHHGIHVPRYALVSTQKELEQACKSLGFPVVCKGVMKDAYIAKDNADALIFFEKIRQTWHGGTGSIIVQEFIAGEFFCVAGVTNEKGKFVYAVQMKKLGIDSKGSTWSGVTVFDRTLKRLTDQVIRAVQWRGPFELEFIRQYKTNKFYLFEVNPRVPSWIHLATVAGQNIPEAIVQIALNKHVEPKETYAQDLMFTRTAEELIYPVPAIHDGLLQKKSAKQGV
ncbi:MAG: ATP-grasp domain-containing protein [Candidatus Aenigmarchaeota archaeon]|nr:ATP-grasp domain-containing protein [Candidatus Aenigmarchaeota archaeon]